MTLPPVSDAAVEAFMHRRHELAGKPSTAEWLVRECMTAALPHLLPRELLIEAADKIEAMDGNLAYDRGGEPIYADLARRLRERAGG